MVEARIETQRLILRPPKIEDFDAWCAMMADEETARHIGGVQAPPVVWRGMAQMAGSFALVGFGMFSLLEKDTGRWIGRAGPWSPHGWPGTEIGWGISRDAWGKGLASEAAVALMDYAVDVLGWTDIVHTIAPDNVRSQKLAERLGSRIRSRTTLPPPFATIVDVWAQTAEEWKARRRPT
jgi:RimJ/RimL family protein N-acetyltransferase